jgi:hypothetical protein
MVIEIGGTRIISSHLGSSVYVWASTISFVLLSLSAGYYFGGKMARTGSLWIVLALAGISTFMVPIMGAAVIPLTKDFSIEFASLAAGMILVPPSLLYGMVSPMISGILGKKEKEKALGLVFGISTIGSIFGVVATGLFLVRFFPLTQIFFGAMLVMLAAGAASFWGARK